eukprot:350029-Chlamydomonas_euryale.AAC.3
MEMLAVDTCIDLESWRVEMLGVWRCWECGECWESGRDAGECQERAGRVWRCWESGDAGSPGEHTHRSASGLALALPPTIATQQPSPHTHTPIQAATATPAAPKRCRAAPHARARQSAAHASAATAHVRAPRRARPRCGARCRGRGDRRPQTAREGRVAGGKCEASEGQWRGVGRSRSGSTWVVWGRHRRGPGRCLSHVVWQSCIGEALGGQQAGRGQIDGVAGATDPRPYRCLHEGKSVSVHGGSEM